MELLESILLDSIKGKRDKLGIAEISYYAKEDSNVFISTLFNIAQYLIEDYPKSKRLYDIELIFDYIKDINQIKDKLDIEFIKKKSKKLEKRIDYIISEKLKNKKKAIEELKVFKEELIGFKNYISNNDHLESDFINYLLETPRNINYIDLVFDKMPDLMKIKDEKGSSLYNNIIEKYFTSVDNEEVNDLIYYKNLLLLMSTKTDFKVPEQEQKRILNEIIERLNKISVDKKRMKDNRYAIEALNNLKNIVVGNNSKQINIREIAKKYDIEVDFNENIINSIKKGIHLNKDNYSDRKRINDYVVSIDGENSVEIDDALSCVKLENGNYLLGVHIASILAYFDYDSEVVQNAFNRMHSIYLHEKSLAKDNMIPIFPLEFSSKYGLLEGEDRLARSYLFEIDKKGNIVNEEFAKTIIKNNKQASYDEINEIIAKGSNEEELNKTVNNLIKVTELLKNKYKTNEVYELIKESSESPTNLRVNRSGSQEIVYRAMTLTGNRVAEFFANNNYPCLYRVHSVSEKLNKKIESLINDLVETYGGDQKEKLYQLATQIYPKSTYDLQGGHEGLKLKHYCHCTSGLRRSSDIMIEHALEVCYDKKPTIEELADLHIEILEKRDLIKTKEDSLDWFVEDVKKTLRKHI